MADPISGAAAVGTLLQQIQASYAGLKNNPSTSQALITQLQKTAAPVKAFAVTLPANAAGLSSNLPRGSIVDVSV